MVKLDEAPAIPQWEAWNTANSAAEHHLCLALGWDANQPEVSEFEALQESDVG